MSQISGLFKFGPFELNQRLDTLGLSTGDCRAWQDKISSVQCEQLKTDVYTQLLQHFEHSDSVSPLLGHFQIHQSLDTYLDSVMTQEVDVQYVETLAKHVVEISQYELMHEYYSIIAHALHATLISNLAQFCATEDALNVVQQRLQLDLSILLQFLSTKSIEDSKRYDSLIEVKDPLTDLYCFNSFSQELDKVLARCKRQKSSALLLKIRVEGLSTINKRFGYEAGNTALQSFAYAIQELVRQPDLVVRGDDESFYIALENTSNQDGKTICKRIIDTVESHSELPITLQIGGACFGSQEVMEREELIDLAHEHLELARARSLINHRHEYSIHFDSKDNLIQLIKS